MDVAAELADLRARVGLLEDRAAVAACIAAHARGCDRHDLDLIASAYWPDGVDEHGRAVNSGTEYGPWANAVHGATSAAHLHHVTTQTCEIAGDEAHAESYVVVILLAPNERSAQVITGRYLDRLERRDGEWRIAVRRSTVETMFAADAAGLGSSFFTEQAYLRGVRDADDVSYVRPLTLAADGPRWAGRPTAPPAPDPS